jgi:predicted DNA-binding WGR domain protein
MAFLTRTDPTRNINRFYIVQIMPSLFGDWTVLREVGPARLARNRAAQELPATQ